METLGGVWEVSELCQDRSSLKPRQSPAVWAMTPKCQEAVGWLNGRRVWEGFVNLHFPSLIQLYVLQTFAITSSTSDVTNVYHHLHLDITQLDLRLVSRYQTSITVILKQNCVSNCEALMSTQPITIQAKTLCNEVCLQRHCTERCESQHCQARSSTGLPVNN